MKNRAIEMGYGIDRETLPHASIEHFKILDLIKEIRGLRKENKRFIKRFEECIECRIF